tara:strand:- start:149 stop:502 length:354 start_codon:yes stop_codon:yes gene_type:complete
MGFCELETRSWELLLEQEGETVTYFTEDENPDDDAGTSRTAVWNEQRGLVEDDELTETYDRFGILDCDDADAVDEDGQFRIATEMWQVLRAAGRDSVSIGWLLGRRKTKRSRRTRSR